jgi:hypothetical protein
MHYGYVGLPGDASVSVLHDGAWVMMTVSDAVRQTRIKCSDLLGYWNSTHKEELLLGEATGGVGHIFPAEDFYMEFYWSRNDKRRRCVSVVPKWPFTDVYITAVGDIDMRVDGGTQTERLKKCTYE